MSGSKLETMPAVKLWSISNHNHRNVLSNYGVKVQVRFKIRDNACREAVVNFRS